MSGLAIPFWFSPSSRVIFSGRATLLIGLLVSWLTVSVGRADEQPRHFVLELDTAIERGGTTGVLFDFGDGIWGENSSVATVPPGATPTTVRLQLPTRPIRNVRFDPVTDDSSVLIARMRLLTDTGKLLLDIDPKSLRPMHQIREIVPEGEGVRIHPTPKADDPMLRLELPPLQKRMHDALQRPTVNRRAVVFLGLLFAMLVLTAVIAAARAIGSRTAWLGGFSVFCVVFGLRLLVLNFFGRPVPFWDEWEGDVLYILIPFTGGFLDWEALFMPQWEHRILLTRVITLFGTLANGEWDPRVAMTVSAGMFAATIGILGTALLATNRWLGALVAAGLTVCAALPYDFNNLLWGGQTQMYGLVLLAVCTLSLASAPRITPMVFLGAAAGGVISLFTMGAGLVGPGCAVGICLVRCWFERDQRRALAGLAAVFFSVALAGVFLHVSSRAHVPLYATTFAQFQRAFVGALAWPLPPRVVWAMVIWLPWIVNGLLILRRRGATPLEWLAVGLGGWGLVNAIALGYARQYEGPPFDSRFSTPMSVGVWASLCSSVALGLRARSWKASTVPHLAWIVAVVGFALVGVKGIAGARETGATRAELDHRIRVLLSTGDRAPILEKSPHHVASDAADRLEMPLFQQIMPGSYRRALAARNSPASAQRIEAGPVTLAARTLMKLGPVMVVIGLLGGGFWLLKVRQERPALQEKGAFRRWPDSIPETYTDRACYVGAGAVTIAWFLFYNSVERIGFVDEIAHISNIFHFLENRAGWPESMPMLPGYHFIAVSLWKLRVFPGDILTVGRLVTMGMTLLGLAAFAQTWRRLHERPAGRVTLLLALLPLTQPFTAMIYTDVPGLAFALCAVWAQVRGWRALAALALVGAIGVRQTNLAWAGFLIAWEWVRTDEPRTTWWRRTVWLLLLNGAALAWVLWAGRLTVGLQHANDFRFNPATLHFGAILVLLLALPIWLAHIPEVVRRGKRYVRDKPTRAALILVGGAVAAAFLACSYSNPHVWNRDLFWEGCTFTLLRNWPLVWIDGQRWLRVASGITCVLVAAALAITISRQPRRVELWLALGFGALPVLTTSLVEPRYFIPAIVGSLLFLDFNKSEWRSLAAWWALLSTVHAPFIAKALVLW